MKNLQTLLAKSEELEAKATPGPWCWSKEWEKDIHNSSYDGPVGCLEPRILWFGMDGEEGIYCPNKEDSEIIIHARNTQKKLLEIIRLQNEALQLYKTMEAPGTMCKGDMSRYSQAAEALARVEQIAGEALGE